jgi:hypothetical protein
MHKLYFIGDDHSFVNQYSEHIATWEGPDGEVVYEAPAAMVTLVATVVSAKLYMLALYLHEVSALCGYTGMADGFSPAS